MLLRVSNDGLTLFYAVGRVAQRYRPAQFDQTMTLNFRQRLPSVACPQSRTAIVPPILVFLSSDEQKSLSMRLAKRRSKQPRHQRFSACLIRVMHHDAAIRNKTKRPESPASGTRITVTVPPHHYEEIVRKAKHKRVSASWIVRDAVERYLADDMPLFANKEQGDS